MNNFGFGPPLLKKFWQRVAFNLGTALIINLMLAWLLTQYNLQDLNQQEFLNGRLELMRNMLNLMSPAQWL